MLTAGVIGWPVAHSKSPLIHRFWLAKLGLDGDYSRFAVHPDNLGAAIRALPALGVRGVNVTVPHKVAARAWVDGLDGDALQIGAINTVVVDQNGTMTGHNTDASGFLDPLSAHLGDIASATVIGAGGAARAVLAALRASRIGEVVVLNRDAARGAALAQDFPNLANVCALTPGCRLSAADLVVNATSLGMTGQPPLDVQLDGLGARTIVYDLVYAPLETPLLAAARARGLRTIDGLAMLVGQAAAAFELFYGAAAPRVHDAELRALLTA